MQDKKKTSLFEAGVPDSSLIPAVKKRTAKLDTKRKRKKTLSKVVESDNEVNSSSGSKGMKRRKLKFRRAKRQP